MSKALWAGLRHLRRRWAVVVFLYSTLLAPALVFGAIAWARLQAALNHSLAGRTLLRDLDLNVFIDLFMHRKDLVVAIAIAALLVGTATLMVWIWLHATTIAAASDDESLSAVLRRGSDLFPRFFRLWLIASLVDVLIIAMFYGIARGLLWLAAESYSEMIPYWIAGGCSVAAAFFLLSSMVIHDHARIHAASTDGEGAASYRWAVRFCLRDERRSLGLAVAVLAMGVALWGGYQSIAMLIPASSPLGVIVSLLWGQLLILARLALRFWYFCAANELQLAAATDWAGESAIVSDYPLVES